MSPDYTFKKHRLSDLERLWLEEAAQPGFSPRTVKVKLHGRLPRDFYPEQIDPRLYAMNRVTPVGLWLVDPQYPLLAAMDRTIRDVQARILKDSSVTSITSEQIAYTSGLTEQAVGEALHALGDIGYFFDQARGARVDGDKRFESIELRGDGSYDNYLHYQGMEDLLERFYKMRGQGLWTAAAYSEQLGDSAILSQRSAYTDAAARSVYAAIENCIEHDGRAYVGNVPREAETILLNDSGGALDTAEASRQIQEAIQDLARAEKIAIPVERYKDWRVIEALSNVVADAQSLPPAGRTRQSGVDDKSHKGRGLGMQTPIHVLRQSILAVPAVKYALGVAGIIAAVAVVYAFRIDARVAFVGAIVMFVLMGVLVVFARMASLAGPRLLLPAQVLSWFTLLLFIAVSVSLFGSVFLHRPLDLSCWLTGNCAMPTTRPDNSTATEPKTADRIRLRVESILFGFQGSPPYLQTSLSIGRIGDGTVLLNDVVLVVNAISRTDGSVLSNRVELVKDKPLGKDAVEAIDRHTKMDSWERMGSPVTALPTFATHYVTFFLQVRGIFSSTGQEVWLDVDMPQPARMTCDYMCVAVYSLNIPAGLSTYKKCTVIPDGANWKTDCTSREDP